MTEGKIHRELAKVDRRSEQIPDELQAVNQGSLARDDYLAGVRDSAAKKHEVLDAYVRDYVRNFPAHGSTSAILAWKKDPGPFQMGNVGAFAKYLLSRTSPEDAFALSHIDEHAALLEAAYKAIPASEFGPSLADRARRKAKLEREREVLQAKRIKLEREMDLLAADAEVAAADAELAKLEEAQPSAH